MRIDRRANRGPICDGVLYRRSRPGAALAVLVFLGIGGGALTLALLGGGLNMPPILLYWIAVWMLLFATIAGWTLRQALRPSNWLLAISDSQCYLNTRSYLNHHFPGDPVIVEFSRREVKQVTRERVRVERGEDVITRHCLVIRLMDTAGLDALAQALRQDRECAANLRFGDYPVEVGPDGAIHVWWDGISPGIKEAERRLRAD